MKIDILELVGLIKELIGNSDKMTKFKEIIADIKELIEDIKAIKEIWWIFLILNNMPPGLWWH